MVAGALIEVLLEGFIRPNVILVVVKYAISVESSFINKQYS